MSSYKYKQIRKTESILNDRLFTFILENNPTENLLDEIELDRSPLDSWIMSDYINTNGNTYIEEFINLYGHTLEPLEIEILHQKLLSYVTMFEVTAITGSKIEIVDRLNLKTYSIIDETIRNILSIGDHILSRLGKVWGEYIFIGQVEYIPTPITDDLFDNIFIYFNRARTNNPELQMEGYLKKHSLDIYSIYKECLVIHMEESEDDIPSIITDIAVFQEYAVDNFPHNYHIHMTNLMEIFEFELMEKELSLQDIDKVDIEKFFINAIKDGFIVSKEDYNSYIDTLKAYLKFLGPSNPKYKETYNRVIQISNNRFKYMSKLQNTNFDYSYDRMLVSVISNRLNDEALTLVGDIDRFLIFAMEFEIGLTPKRKEIQKKELLSLNQLLRHSYPFLNSRPSQKDSRIINLLYHLTLDLGLTAISKDKMVITPKGKNFFKLRDEEKFAIALPYIWSKDFIKNISAPRGFSWKISDEIIEKFLNFEYTSLADLFKDIPDKKTRKSILATGYVRNLILLGLLEYNDDFQVEITSLGRLIYRYMLSIKDKKTLVINMEEYKEKKN